MVFLFYFLFTVRLQSGSDGITLRLVDGDLMVVGQLTPPVPNADRDARRESRTNGILPHFGIRFTGGCGRLVGRSTRRAVRKLFLVSFTLVEEEDEWRGDMR